MCESWHVEVSVRLYVVNVFLQLKEKDDVYV